MNKIITRGFGRSSNRQGIITQGFGGFFNQIVQAGRNVVVRGKRYADRIKEEINEVLVRVTLLSVNDKFVDITGQEKGTIDRTFKKPQVSLRLIKQRTAELIKLSVKRIK